MSGTRSLELCYSRWPQRSSNARDCLPGQSAGTVSIEGKHCALQTKTRPIRQLGHPTCETVLRSLSNGGASRRISGRDAPCVEITKSSSTKLHPRLKQRAMLRNGDGCTVFRDQWRVKLEFQREARISANAFELKTRQCWPLRRSMALVTATSKNRRGVSTNQ